MELILASTSPYRKMLLEARGIPFLASAPTCDEDALKDPSLSGTALTQMLAKAKAESLKEQFPKAHILGSDQVLEFQGKIYGKPKTKERALGQLMTLQGQTHQLVTSLYIHSPHQSWTHTEVVTLTMHPWSKTELQRYIDADLPLDCAGSYKLEKRGLLLFKDIEAKDYESIIGLPLLKLFSILKEEGYPLF
jgi:septum formation protein